MDGHHGLAIHNRKFYYDKLRNELIPIYYDIDSQIENRDLYIKKCDEELLNQYEKFICINNFAEGAIKLLRNIDFESKDIKLDLEQKNININDEYIENIFNKFIENLENISKISSKDNTFTNQHISNFKMNYLNVENSIELLNSSGVSTLEIIRVFLKWSITLKVACDIYKKTKSIDIAIKESTPYVFWKVRPKFEESIRKCVNLNLNSIIDRLLTLEQKIKLLPSLDIYLLSYSLSRLSKMVK